MTIKEELALKQMRLDKLKASQKNIKSPGVVRSLERKIRNLKEKDNG